jgi:hypothetical protein
MSRMQALMIDQGRYLPLFASAVVDLNPYLKKWGMAPVNLASVMIGNGDSDQAS